MMTHLEQPRRAIIPRQGLRGSTNNHANIRYIGVILVLLTVAVLYFNNQSTGKYKYDVSSTGLLDNIDLRNLESSTTGDAPLNHLQTVEKENRSLKNELSNAKAEMENLRTKNRAEGDKLNAQKKSIQAAHKENQALQEKLAIARTELDKLRKKDEAEDDKVTARKKQNDAPQQENQALKDELANARDELDSLRKKQESGGENVIAQKELLEQTESVEILKEELASAKKELKALKKMKQNDEVAETDKKAEQKISSDLPDPTETGDNNSQMVAPCKPLAWPTPPEGTSPELEQVWDITTPWCNTTVSALYTRGYNAGLRNQVMAFTGLVMTSVQDGHNQILLDTLRHKDTYGSNKMAPHEALFDVAHWNSFYPQLPRMVHCDPGIILGYNCSTRDWINSTNGMPMAYKTFGNQHFTAYKRYSKRKGPFADPFPNPADRLIKAGALRPHPDLRAIGDRLLSTMNEKATGPYMTVHARIEPDMQKHPVCKDLKVLNLTTIIEFLETKWNEPPATRIFFPVNRQELEKEGTVLEKEANEETNWIAVNNLKALNRISKEGLWGGRAKVFEFGANALKGTKYEESMSSIGGALLNYHIATNAEIFVGTEVSSYSNDLVATRFYRDNFNNYFYRPDGLHLVTTKDSTEPPAFDC